MHPQAQSHSSERSPVFLPSRPKLQLDSPVSHSIQERNKALNRPIPLNPRSRRISTHYNVLERSSSSDRHLYDYICQPDYSALSRCSKKELKIFIIDTIILLLKQKIIRERTLPTHRNNINDRRSSSDEERLFAPKGAIYQRHQTRKDNVSFNSLRIGTRNPGYRSDIALSYSPQVKSCTKRRNRNESNPVSAQNRVNENTPSLPRAHFEMNQKSCLPEYKLLTSDDFSKHHVTYPSQTLTLNCPTNGNEQCDNIQGNTRDFYERKSVLQSHPKKSAPSCPVSSTGNTPQTHPDALDPRQSAVASDHPCRKYVADDRSSIRRSKTRFQIPAVEQACDKQTATRLKNTKGRSKEGFL